jgi:hypothetical protein
VSENYRPVVVGVAQVRVDPEAGAIVWPGGIDLAPEPRFRTGKGSPARCRLTLPDPPHGAHLGKEPGRLQADLCLITRGGAGRAVSPGSG